ITPKRPKRTFHPRCTECGAHMWLSRVCPNDKNQHQRTFECPRCGNITSRVAVQKRVSALTSKTDSCIAHAHVRFASEADICSAQAHVCFTPIATVKADISNRSCLLYPHKRTCAVH